MENIVNEDGTHGIEFVNGGSNIKISDENLDALACSFVEGVFDGVRAIDDVQLSKQFEERKKSYRNLLANPSALIVRSGDDVIGVISAEKLSGMRDGRPFVEITDVTVLPDYRGRRLSSDMGSMIFKAINEQYVNPIVVARSRDLKVQHMCTRSGGAEIPMNHYRRLIGLPDLPENKIADAQRNGWKFFISDVDLAKLEVAPVVQSTETNKAIKDVMGGLSM